MHHLEWESHSYNQIPPSNKYLNPTHMDGISHVWGCGNQSLSKIEGPAGMFTTTDVPWSATLTPEIFPRNFATSQTFWPWLKILIPCAFKHQIEIILSNSSIPITNSAI